MSGSPRFDFYEEVRVLSGNGNGSPLVGQTGVILGRTETEDQKTWYYAVQISDGRGWCFYESELETTGNHFLRKDFYDGSSIRVRVDDSGRGTIVSPHEDSDV